MSAGRVRWRSLDELRWRSLEAARIQLRHRSCLSAGQRGVYDNFYPQASSQWDSLAHVGYAPDQMYNGVTESEVLAGTRNTIDHWPPIAPLTACTRCSWSAGR